MREDGLIPLRGIQGQSSSTLTNSSSSPHLIDHKRLYRHQRGGGVIHSAFRSHESPVPPESFLDGFNVIRY